ncbi:MAG: hypothetical protein FD130_1526 [Halothiobacillaceae bacterium]|nr:MAG: hypothetical protein FD130_1526 [Halothiobacillaceae bacterium]
MNRIGFAGLALLLSVGGVTPANAEGVDGKAVIGGALGGAAGAAVGSAAGGRNAAIIGSALGAAAGTAIATNKDEKVVVESERVIERRVIVDEGHQDDHHHDRGRHRGHHKHKKHGHGHDD